MGEIQKKDNWIQIIRGICIICVIFIHTQNADIYRYNISNQSIWWGYVVLRNIFNFPVGIFFFLSGYLVKKEKVLNNNFDYIKNRIIRLGIPFIIWSLFYTIIYIYMEYPKIETGIIISKIVKGNIAPHLYFVLVLLQFAIITPLLIKIENTKWEKLIWVITPIYIFINFIYALHFKTTIDSNQLFFPCWIIYYFLGLKLNSLKINKMGKFNKKIYIIAFIFLLISILDSILLHKLHMESNYVYSQIRLGMIPYILLIAFIIQNNQFVNTFNSKFLKFIGDYSYGIYYVHIFFIMVINKIYIDFCPYKLNLFLLEFIEIILSLLLSIISCIIVRKLIGKKNSMLYLGM